MSTDSTSANAGGKLRVHTLLSVVTIVIGVALMAYMIVVEDEPGAIPLLLIVLGFGWYFATRARIRSRLRPRSTVA